MSKHTNYFIDRNLQNRHFSLDTQDEYAKVWNNLDPETEVVLTQTIEGALHKARSIGDQNQGMQTLITGSLHLVSGALCLLTPLDEEDGCT